MTKTLTEKWKDMDLADEHLYYWRMPNGEVRIMTKMGVYSYKLCYGLGEIDILEPVPSYDEYKRLQEKLDIVTEQRNDIHIDKQVLQEQLNEANEVIKITNRVSGNIDLSQLVYEDRRKVDGITMQTGEYLEKWGVK